LIAGVKGTAEYDSIMRKLEEDNYAHQMKNGVDHEHKKKKKKESSLKLTE
jgi:hypothetical protein